METHHARAYGIALGFLADAAFADPAHGHPVAVFGSIAARVEAMTYPRTGAPHARFRGVLYTVALVGGAGLGVRVLDVALVSRPALRVAVTATTVWACLGGTSLLRIAGRHADLLENSDVAGSRELLPWLCGRDPVALGAGQLARAVVESVAENTSDAAVATLFWGAVAGPAGAAAHRAANTLDAMVGHRSARYAEYGWASARLDDLLGWPAARLAGLLTAGLAPLVGGRSAGALRAWRRDAGSHPSPNAGVVEAACAGALGVRLGGSTPYSYGVEQRPRLGRGPAPRPSDIRRAVRLMRAVQVGAATGCVLVLVACSRRAGDTARRDQVRRRSARRNARRCSASWRSP